MNKEYLVILILVGLFIWAMVVVSSRWGSSGLINTFQVLAPDDSVSYYGPINPEQGISVLGDPFGLNPRALYTYNDEQSLKSQIPPYIAPASGDSH